jgi:hypothetical protein
MNRPRCSERRWIALVVGMGSLACSPAPQEEAAPARPQPGSTAPPAATSQTIDAQLEEVLRVDHSQTAYAIRISADDTLEEARAIARDVLGRSRFLPWIVRQGFGKGLFFVYVGGYSNSEAATADRLDARAVVGQGAIVQAIRDECPYLAWNGRGYHDCTR